MEEYDKLFGVKLYYVGEQFMKTLDKEPDQQQSFSHNEVFDTGSLAECRSKAIAYYIEMYENFRAGKATYVRPFARPDNYELGKHAAYSISLLFIQDEGEQAFFGFALAGENLQETIESLEREELVLCRVGNRT